jgi:hypothetical protein
VKAYWKNVVGDSLDRCIALMESWVDQERVKLSGRVQLAVAQADEAAIEDN